MTVFVCPCGISIDSCIFSSNVTGLSSCSLIFSLLLVKVRDLREVLSDVDDV